MGGLRPRAGVLSRLSITERIQESNCCAPRSICRCCNAMMVRIEPLMQQPTVCPICELYFGLESGGQSATMNAATSSDQPVPR